MFLLARRNPRRDSTRVGGGYYQVGFRLFPGVPGISLPVSTLPVSSLPVSSLPASPSPEDSKPKSKHGEARHAGRARDVARGDRQDPVRLAHPVPDSARRQCTSSATSSQSVVLPGLEVLVRRGGRYDGRDHVHLPRTKRRRCASSARCTTARTRRCALLAPPRRSSWRHPGADGLLRHAGAP